MIRGIHHVALSVTSLEKTAKFYRDAFGFEPAFDAFSWCDRPEIDRAIGVPGSAAKSQMFKSGNFYIEVFEYDAPAPEVCKPLNPNDRGYTHFAIDVVDIEMEMVRLAAAGMRFATDKPIDGPGIRSIYGYDIDGNVIELQELASDHPMVLNWECEHGG